MMVRHLMWRMHDRFGDATVTAALIYQSVFAQGVKYVTHGGNAMLLRRQLDKGAQLVMDALSKQAVPVTSQEQLVRLAETLCRDSDLARNLGEALMKVGRYGQVDIRAGQGRSDLLEYIHGMTWKGEFFSRSMVWDPMNYRSEQDNPAVLVSNLIIDNPYELAEWLETLIRSGIKQLFLLAKEIRKECLDVLEAANRSEGSIRVLAVKLWETTERWELQDLSVLTGSAIFVREAGHHIAHVRPDHLGRAGRVWVERSRFGIIDGKGGDEKINLHSQNLLAGLERLKDEKLGRKLRDRIAGFAGLSTIYWIGGATRIDIENRVGLGQRTLNVLRGALADGVLPGGAIALLECAPAVAEMCNSQDEHTRAAGRIIDTALKVPLQALLTNCGENPYEVMARIKRRGSGYGFDVHRRKVTKMDEAGILDTANAVKAAAYGGITGAALGLTVDVVIHPKKRKESYTTG